MPTRQQRPATNRGLQICNRSFILDDGQPNILCLAVPHGQPEKQTEADIEALPRPRRMAAIATRVAWSQDESPASDAWALVAVDPHSPAIFLVRRVGLDTRWTCIPNPQLPWFAAATAGGLREWLGGKPLTLRQAEDQRLFGRVRDGDKPPLHPDGTI